MTSPTSQPSVLPDSRARPARTMPSGMADLVLHVIQDAEAKQRGNEASHGRIGSLPMDPSLRTNGLVVELESHCGIRPLVHEVSISWGSARLDQWGPPGGLRRGRVGQHERLRQRSSWGGHPPGNNQRGTRPTTLAYVNVSAKQLTARNRSPLRRRKPPLTSSMSSRIAYAQPIAAGTTASQRKRARTSFPCRFRSNPLPSKGPATQLPASRGSARARSYSSRKYSIVETTRTILCS